MSYLEALDRELADLAPEERADLLDEVEASLAEIEDDPELRLGPPNRFAAELRASAGLPPAPPDEPARTEHPFKAAARTIAPAARELAPIWWLVRAYVAVVLAAELFARPFDQTSGIPRVDDSAQLGAVILAATIVASIALGLATRHKTRKGLIALDLALLAATLALAGYEINRRVLSDYKAPAALAAPTAGLVHDGVRVTNLYAYGRDGRMLRDVQLFDEFGRPLEITPNDPDPARRILRTEDGTQVFNTFPIRYREPGTNHVKHFDAAPPGLKQAARLR